ncbi:MAG: type I-B CRISPR-associated protein Cas8b1/Cst1 [Bacteroidota bacterium]
MTDKINKSWLTKRTGDPFADTGGYTLKYLLEESHYKDQSVLQLIETIAKIYVYQWGAGQLSPFFLNSTITQPSFKGERKIQETIKFYKGMIEESVPYEHGYCRILGVKTKLFAGARSNHLLSGSGTFINFHHAFQEGIMLSKEALIRMFFLPFGTIRLSDKIAVLGSNNERIVQTFVAENVKNNISRIAARNANSMLASEFNNPASALFDFVKSYMNNDFYRIIKEEETTAINLYHFTNFGASPEVVLHTFSAPLFDFYRQMMYRKLVGDWQKFVRAHYYNSKHKNVTYDASDETYDSKKEQNPLKPNQYEKWINWIYQDLLNNKSILPKILKWSKAHPFKFKIVRLYQQYYSNMNEKTLDKIEQIADFIVSDRNLIRRRLGTLNRANRIYEIRRFLLSLVNNNHAQGNKEPLFSLSEYVNYLFPDGSSGREIRDLLLIAVYQKMHEQGIFFDDPIEEVETEENLIEESN